jgi:hypothetical protein
MVIHTGDIVTDEGKRGQWKNANDSMGILLDNGVPYCWDAGNHDYSDTPWIGSQFAAFNPAVMQTKPYWVSDEFDGVNTAVHFNVSGWDCLIVNIAFHANDSALAWANNLKNTVLDTHANVFLTLSAHYHPTAGVRNRVGEREELMFDMQYAQDDVGAASA